MLPSRVGSVLCSIACRASVCPIDPCAARVLVPCAVAPKVCGHLSLMMALVPSLSLEQVNAVYAVVTPLLMDGQHSVVQKRAYKVWSTVPSTHGHAFHFVLCSWTQLETHDLGGSCGALPSATQC